MVEPPSDSRQSWSPNIRIFDLLKFPLKPLIHIVGFEKCHNQIAKIFHEVAQSSKNALQPHFLSLDF